MNAANPTPGQAFGTNKAAPHLLWVCMGLLTLAMVFLSALQYGKYASTFETRTRERYVILATHWTDTIEAQLALGLSMSESTSVTSVLNNARHQTKGLMSIGVMNDRGQVVQSDGNLASALWQQAHIQSHARTQGIIQQEGSTVLAFPLKHAFGERAGTLVLSYDERPAHMSTLAAFQALLPWAIGSWVLGLMVLAVVMPWLKEKTNESDTQHNQRLTLVLTVLLLGLQAVFAWHAVVTLRQVVKDDAPMLAHTFMQTLAPTWERAISHGIPLSELRGVEPWLSSSLRIGPEFVGVRVSSVDGQPVSYAAGEFLPEHLHQSYAMPTTSGQASVATQWDITLNPAILAARTRQIMVEFLMVLLASVVIFHEILKSLSHHVHKKAVSDAAPTGITLTHLRVPLFLFFLASELPRSFLPVWSQDLAQLPLWPQWLYALFPSLHESRPLISPDLLTSLPVALFLLSVALVSPWSGRLCARHGARALLLWGLSCALTGHVLAINADTWSVLCLARLLAGASFGMVSVAAIDFIARHQGAKAGGMAMYLTAYVGAGIAGAGLGSVLADRMSTSAVFLFGSLMVLWGGLLVWRWHLIPTAAAHTVRPSPSATSLAHAPPMQHSGTSSAWSLLSHGALWRLLLWMAFPMQMVQQGLLFYWTPLALASLGEHSSFTGMAMMGYFLAVLLLNQPLARQADRSGRHTQWITMGLTLMGCAGLLVGWWHESWILAVAVVLIGIAWAMSFPSQGAVMLKTTRQHCPDIEPAVALAGIRTFERLAGMLSPLIVAACIAQWGAGSTALGLGVCLLVCAGLLRLGHTQLASNHAGSHS